jgi:hypothetical protein
VEVGSYEVPGDYARDVAVSGSYIFVANNEAGLQIFRNLLPGGREEVSNKGQFLKVAQKLFMGTSEVQVNGVNLTAELDVYDVTGRIMEKRIVYNSSPVEIGANLKPGIYFVKVKGLEPVKILKLK